MKEYHKKFNKLNNLKKHEQKIMKNENKKYWLVVFIIDCITFTKTNTKKKKKNSLDAENKKKKKLIIKN